MSRTYTPRPGSFSEKAVEHFRAHPDAEEDSNALAALIEANPKNMSGLMQRAIANGVIAVRRAGRSCYYSLGTGEAADTDQPGTDHEAEQPADHLTVALYNDGELLMSGINGVEGFITLSAGQTAQRLGEKLYGASLVTVEPLPRGSDHNLTHWRLHHEVAGPSPRHADTLHACVGLDCEQVFDPHPSRAGLTSQSTCGVFIALQPWRMLA